MGVLDQPAGWAAYSADIESEVGAGIVAAPVRDGEGLKERLLAALEHFW